jgi:signal transduction histidine kinase
MVVSAVVGGFVGPVHLVFLGWSAAAVLLGDVLRNRRTYLSQLEERNRFLERTREEEARRRIAEERLRIARDLHDSVAHAMATISVQAGAAAHVVDRRPEAAKEALTAIRQASGEVLDELSALLGVLREDSRPPGTTPDRAPQQLPSTVPGFESVPALVEATRSAGLPVTLCVDGPVEAVDRHRGQAAYRIVQEALTNVLRHSGPSPTRVLVRAEQGGGLCVRVVNEPPVAGAVPTGGGGAGLGIRGMRERAAAAGGVLRAGHDDDGGFTVEATWPAR